ncbi:type I polyketide synthase [Streptomyces paromomycinus]|uniref:type I polyketide synthase n=1 Tax=Streptomyces paromomycinus TaxID=92743 RepID=UPI000F615F6A|nr:type I polyketide synthase [Streptomyces paromomycinus]
MHSNEERLRDYLKRVTGDLQAARARVRELEEDSRDAVAVIGMGCRWPGGVSSPDDLWRLLTGDTDGISAFPDNRGWDVAGLYDPTPGTPGRTHVRTGGFLHDADLFDAEFFGIDDAEATMMDPQQRLLLETGWEAMEDARIDPRTLRGSDTGVFLGMARQPYGDTVDAFPEDGVGHRMTGSITSVAAGRLSYTFGFEGPSTALDAACASGLVALHLARQSLRNRDCSLALVGAATVMADAEIFLEYSRQDAMAPDGRCKSFSAAADGAGWADGVGVVLLERLSDAVRNGRRVLAVVRGSAVNHDGASNGLTAPNGPSQQRMIRKALADARLSPGRIDLVEGHGTGTPLGDAIEADALLAAYGAERDRPLWLGSVKSHLGHPQAAAGMAGLMKVVLALRHGTLPPSRYADRPAETVERSPGALRLVARAAPWPETGQPRRAAVSAFGVSGTNVHTILEQAPEQTPEPAGTAPGAEPGDRAVPWVLSGRTPGALRDQARRLLADLAARPGRSVRDIGWSLALTRASFAHRAAVLGDDRDALTAGLRAVADGRAGAGVVRGGSGGRRQIVFAFPEYGGAADRDAWAELVATLRDRSPGFSALYERCRTAAEASLSDAADTQVDTQVDAQVDDQVTAYAAMAALANLWRSSGVRPAAVVGDGLGEIAAACAVGAVRPEDGARMAALRGSGGDPGAAAPAVAETDAAFWYSAGQATELVLGTVPAGHWRSAPAGSEALEKACAQWDGPLVIWFGVPGGAEFGVPGDAESGVPGGTEADASADVPDRPGAAVVIPGAHHRDAADPLLPGLATAFAYGASPDWRAAYDGTGGRAVSLPTYAFQRRGYWLGRDDREGPDIPEGHDDRDSRDDRHAGAAAPGPVSTS